METSITFDSFAPIQSPSKNYKRQLFPVHDRKLYITVWKNTANLLDVVQLYSKQRRKEKKKKDKLFESFTSEGGITVWNQKTNSYEMMYYLLSMIDYKSRLL